MTTHAKKSDLPGNFFTRIFSHWAFIDLVIDIFGGFLIILLQKPGTSTAIAIGFTLAGYIAGITAGFLYLFERKYKKPAVARNYTWGIAIAAILALLFACILSVLLPFALVFFVSWILPGVFISFLETWTIRLLLKKKAKWWVWALATLGLIAAALVVGIFAIGSAVQYLY